MDLDPSLDLARLLNRYEVGGRTDWSNTPPPGRTDNPGVIYACEYFALEVNDAVKILERLEPQDVWTEDHFAAYAALEEYFRDSHLTY